MKKIYIAAPFFSPQQLATVKAVEEKLSLIKGIEFYSPRLDGVLQDMTPEERAASMQRIFDLNVEHIQSSHALLAILDEKDTGTTWELGFMYGLCAGTVVTNRSIMSYTSTKDVKLNVMLNKCIGSHAVGLDELGEMLRAYADDKCWCKMQSGDVY